jgi:putative transposase
VTAIHGKPEQLQVDNGSEIIGRAATGWREGNHVLPHPIEAGKPPPDGHIESFNGRFRDECLT